MRRALAAAPWLWYFGSSVFQSPDFQRPPSTIFNGELQTGQPKHPTPTQREGPMPAQKRPHTRLKRSPTPHRKQNDAPTPFERHASPKKQSQAAEIRFSRRLSNIQTSAEAPANPHITTPRKHLGRRYAMPPVPKDYLVLYGLQMANRAGPRMDSYFWGLQKCWNINKNVLAHQ